MSDEQKSHHKPIRFSRRQRIINLFRKLWEQHDVWTRDTITGIVFELPTLEFAIARLLQNPDDFGRAFSIFFGRRIGQRFSVLLREHLTLAADLVTAAKNQDNERVQRIERKWFMNAQEIAIFLGKINPFWSRKEWSKMLKEHLRLVRAEAVFLLTGDYENNVAIYDEIERQTLEMADELSIGIIKKFRIK